MSQREVVLRAIAPGHLVYVRVPGHCEGIYQFVGATHFGAILLGECTTAVVRWSEILPPF